MHPCPIEAEIADFSGHPANPMSVLTWQESLTDIEPNGDIHYGVAQR